MLNKLDPRQILVEEWKVRFTRSPFSRMHGPDHMARMDFPHPVIIATSGRGYTIEQARIDCLVKMAAGYIDCLSMEDDVDWQISDETLKVISKAVRSEQARRRKILKARQEEEQKNGR